MLGDIRYRLAPLMLVLLAACDDEGEGRDTTWTGLSGWVLGLLVGIVLLAVFFSARRRRR